MPRPMLDCRCIAGVLLLLAACGGSGEDVPLAPGRYLYQASHPTPAGGDSIRLRGVLEITAGGADGVEGRWDVPQLHPELETREAPDGDPRITAQPTYFGTIVHRITSAPGGAVHCSGEYTWIADKGEERSLPLTCTLSSNVPAGYDPSTPDPAAPAVRTASPDSLSGSR